MLLHESELTTRRFLLEKRLEHDRGHIDWEQCVAGLNFDLRIICFDLPTMFDLVDSLVHPKGSIDGLGIFVVDIEFHRGVPDSYFLLSDHFYQLKAHRIVYLVVCS
jgi:hypothetical protein